MYILNDQHDQIYIGTHPSYPLEWDVGKFVNWEYPQVFQGISQLSTIFFYAPRHSLKVC